MIFPHVVDGHNAADNEMKCHKTGIAQGDIFASVSRRNFAFRKRSPPYKSASLHMPVVRVTYNEDSNVIVMVTGDTSQMTGSEFFQDKQLFPGYRPMGLSRNSACSKIINRQK